MSNQSRARDGVLHEYTAKEDPRVAMTRSPGVVTRRWCGRRDADAAAEKTAQLDPMIKMIFNIVCYRRSLCLLLVGGVALMMRMWSGWTSVRWHFQPSLLWLLCLRCRCVSVAAASAGLVARVAGGKSLAWACRRHVGCSESAGAVVRSGSRRCREFYDTDVLHKGFAVVAMPEAMGRDCLTIAIGSLLGS